MNEVQAKPSGERRNLGCSLLLIIAIMIPIVASRFGSSVKATNTVDRSDACFMSQKFVTQNLKAPSTADFPDWTEDNCKVKQAAGTWIVTSFVDAENSFGAMIRTDYVAQMTYNSASDKWTLKNLAMDGN